jgi:hypothetical protein
MQASPRKERASARPTSMGSQPANHQAIDATSLVCERTLIPDLRKLRQPACYPIELPDESTLLPG